MLIFLSPRHIWYFQPYGIPQQQNEKSFIDISAASKIRAKCVSFVVSLRS